MNLSIEHGADIIIHQWYGLKSHEKLLIISDENHLTESMALWKAARAGGAFAMMITIPENCSQPGHLFDSMSELFSEHHVIIGATRFSLITTRAVQKVLSLNSRFLSLPLCTNRKCSMLELPFLTMDPHLAERLSRNMMMQLNLCENIHITTALGTDLTFRKRGRTPGLFNGMAETPGKIGSSSFEIYIGIEETFTEGHAVVDGSLGYLGCPCEPISLTFHQGKLTEIEQNPSGIRLKQYMEQFHDPRIFTAGELGIGLNQKARCDGNCYIEDESAYGTFHIGMGRNLALGGVHDANGHFDLVFHQPTIYADDVLIMKDGNALLSSY